MRETGAVRFNIDGDREEAKKYVGFARTLLGQLKVQMRGNNIQVLSRALLLEDGVAITVLSVFGQDMISINVPEIALEALAPETTSAEPTLVGIGWAQQATLSRSFTGVMASTFEQLSAVLLKGNAALTGWQLGALNFLDCDTVLFAGARSGSTPGIFSLASKADIYITFGASTASPGIPAVFPSQDGRTIITATPNIISDSLTTYDIHQHTIGRDNNGTVVKNTAYAGTIGTGVGSSPVVRASPVLDRELTRAVWWDYASDFVLGGDAPPGAGTDIAAHSISIPGGAVSNYALTVPADQELYTGYDSDPAWFAQTLADIPSSAVRPSNDARPWWVRRQVRAVIYWSGIANGYMADDIPLGVKAMLWCRDAIMRGNDEAFAPTDNNYAHIIQPTQFGFNTGAGIAVYVYKKVGLVQDVADTFLPDNPNPGVHPVTFNGAKVYREAVVGTDPEAAITYEMLVCEGNGVTYSAPLPGSALSANIHANGLAILISDETGATYVLERAAGGWVRNEISFPAVVEAVVPAFASANTQPISVSNADGTFAFNFYSFPLPTGAPSIDIYLTSIAKQREGGGWAYSEKKVGRTLLPLALGPSRPITTLFRAFGALRPYLV